MSRLILILIIALFVYATFFFVMTGLLLRHSFRLNAYVKKNKHQRWRELSSVGTSVGVANQPRWWAYVKSDQDNDDVTILRLKDQVKSCTRWVLIGILAILAHVVLMSVLTVRGAI